MSAADGLPPRCDVETERAVLGCVLLAPESLAVIAAKLTAEDFTLAAHRATFEAFLDLDKDGRKIDSLSLGQSLLARRAFNAVGGGPYITALSDCGVTTAHLEDHVMHLAELSAARRVGKDAWELHRKARDPSVPLASLLEAAQRLGDASPPGGAAAPVALGPAIDEVLTAMAHPTPEGEALSTGVKGLDAQLRGGLRAGQLAILAARPAMGKSALAMQIALNVARTTNRPVLFFSLEMPRKELVQRCLASEGKVDLERVLAGAIGPDDMVKLTDAAAKVYTVPLLLDARDELRVHELRAVAQSVATRQGLAMIVVDYLQLLQPTDRYRDSREREVAEMSRGLKSLAKRLGVPILCLAQLNRGPEKSDKYKRPQLSDLRESGAIEQDADVVSFLFRPWVYDKDADAGECELNVAKQRNGPPGVVPLRFVPSQTRFEDVKREDWQAHAERSRPLAEAAPDAPRDGAREDSGEWAVGDE